MAQLHKFVLVTFNTHGRFSWSSLSEYKRIGEAFEALVPPPHVIHLQEVWSYAHLFLLRYSMKSYPYIAYTPGIYGPRAGLVTFSRLPLRATHFFDIPPVSEPKKQKRLNRWKRALKQKGASCSLLSGSLVLCNCHLVANGDADWSPQSRYAQAHRHDLHLLASLITSLSSQKQTVLVTGDFNIPKCSTFYQEFVDQAQVHDLFAADETPTFHQAFLPPGAIAHCIDYIFACAPHAISTSNIAYLFQEKVGHTYLSDHIGLLAEVDGLFEEEGC